MATEAEILKTLYHAHRNTGKQFFSHVKTGSSWVRKGHLHILDGLGVKPSWTRPEYHGYEIKVSRGDFLRDDKYVHYLPYCTAFSFVVPRDMVKKTEIAENVGLIYYQENGLLRTVKKAPILVPEPELLRELLRYLVYYRTGTDREKIRAAASEIKRSRQLAAYWEKQAVRKNDDYYAAVNKLYELGYYAHHEDGETVYKKRGE